MKQEVMGLIGGSALLLYAIEEISRSVQYIGGPELRKLIQALRGSKIASGLLGILLALFTSSSGAVSIMMVGMANARLLTLDQIFALTLGASVGATFIVYLFAAKISSYGLLVVACGICLKGLLPSTRWERAARVIISLGMLFFAMDILFNSVRDIQGTEIFHWLFGYFSERPFWVLLVSSLIAALLHSSAGMLGIVVSFMSTSDGSLLQALPWILGANIGTTATAFLASRKGSPLGKQVALAQFLFKSVGVLVVFPLMVPISEWIASLTPAVGRQIALTHTLFNVALMIAFFPFIHFGVRVVRAIFPDTEADDDFEFKYINPKNLPSPELALEQAQREIYRLGKSVTAMADRSLLPFRDLDRAMIDEIRKMDELVDFLNKGIKLSLAKLPQQDMGPELMQRELELVVRTSDLENIGDIIDRNIMGLAGKMIERSAVFSKEGKRELEVLHERVMRVLALSIEYFEREEPDIRQQLVDLEKEVDALCIDLLGEHVSRLHGGGADSLATSAIHIDMISNYQRILNLSTNFLRIEESRRTS